MSLKAIEMQIALPRTFDAAKQTAQLNIHNHVAQSAAGTEMEKELNKKRHTATGIEQKGNAGLQKDHDRNHEQDEHKKQRDSTSEENKFNPHPYKGKKIDCSG
ncbi:hypothetical protein [Bacillus sp. Marseille-Q1617]|uniref:hypothetical protein n=1 Tax=Bacillus sp. Marseille-Q1617 TaxID=2736887 RepID=UPI00158C2E3E|nr:hypothetical protein [Bacillus sp. Marseille-Q1617]